MELSVSMYPEFTQPTKKEPLKFFHSLMKTNLLEILRNDFLPNPWVPDGYWPSGLSSYDIEKEEYTIIYEVEVAGHAENKYGYDEWVVDEIKECFKTHSFPEQLNQQLKRQYEISEKKVAEALRDAPTIEKSKQLCQLWLDELMSYRGIGLAEDRFQKYNEITRPLEALIRFLLETYPSFCPNIRKGSELERIREKKWNYTNIIEPKFLSHNFFEELATETYMGEHFFHYENHISQTEKESLVSNLKLIAEGKAEMISSQVKFTLGSKYSYYIIERMKQFCPKMNYANMQRSDKIYINDKLFTENGKNAAKSRFKDDNSALLSQIKIFFEQNTV